MNFVMLVGTVLSMETKSTESAQWLRLRLRTLTLVRTPEGRKVLRHFHNVSAWGQAAAALRNEIATGDLVSVVGQLNTRSYVKDGQKQYMTEVKASSVSPVVTDDTEAESEN